MSYTWWLDTHMIGSVMYFNRIKKDTDDETSAVLNEWIQKTNRNWRFVKRDILKKMTRSGRTSSILQGGVRFELWRDAVEFKMIFSDIIVEGEENSEEFDFI